MISNDLILFQNQTDFPNDILDFAYSTFMVRLDFGQ